jgi:transposase, IS5 family
VQPSAHRALARRRRDGWARRLAGQLDQTVQLTGRLLAQTDQRLAGNRSIPDRVVSLADPDARPIRKGKPRSPTQFGYTLLLAEDERGFVADHQLAKGNPPDAPQLLSSVHRVVAIRGRPPATVVADRGFGFAANDRALAELGVRRIGLQRSGTPSAARRAVDRPARSSGCATGASASRRASATSSAASGCGGLACAAWPAPGPGRGWGSSPTTYSV